LETIGIDKPLPLGTSVKPDEQLSWPHVVATLGACLVPAVGPHGQG